MPSLQVKMLGEFRVRFENETWQWRESCKARELFCYLMIHRAPRHQREHLAETLWCDSPKATAMKNLRQTLWQLQRKYASQQKGTPRHLFCTDSEWLSLHPDLEVWTDVREFEKAAECLRGPSELDDARARILQQAVPLYQGDLLEGWYQDWCLYERERLQNLYLMILGKLIVYCEKHQQYEAGIGYGERVLKYDFAGERTHQRMMSLKHLSGDRTGALRQYERCVKALRDEFGVQPERRTRELYEEIRSDRMAPHDPSPSVTPSCGAACQLSPADLLSQLRGFQATLAELQQQAQQWVQVVEEFDSGQPKD